MQPAPTSLLRTADRALQVLQQFRRPGDTLTVSEIAQRIGLHRSTASRLVATLLTRGFLERADDAESLRLGPETVRLGAIALAGSELLSGAAPVIAALAAETGEAVTLAVASGGRVLTVAEADGKHFVSSGDWIGVSTAAHCTADGKVLLAFGALALESGALAELTEATITDPTTLAEDLQAARRDGFATSHGELEHGLHGIAVPVRDGERCLAALCVSGPEYRLGGDAQDGLARALISAAGELERRLHAGREHATRSRP